VAAYFAAVENAVHAPFDCLAVWALEKGNRNNEDAHLRFYAAPGGTNPNLHAQAGIFTFHFHEKELSLEQYLCHVRAESHEPLTLRRISLAGCEAPRLLELLADEGVDGSSLFPGPDGVARAMREHALWCGGQP
jgi:hypothetical protein